jgi:propionate CoA-transferase
MATKMKVLKGDLVQVLAGKDRGKRGRVLVARPSERRVIARGQQVLYVTERAVFELTAKGLRLVELVPGVDRQSQVLDQMEFQPL